MMIILAATIILTLVVLVLMRYSYYHSSSLTPRRRRDRRAGALGRAPWYVRVLGECLQARNYEVGSETSRRLNGSGTNYGITIQTVEHEIRVRVSIPDLDTDDRAYLSFSHPYITHPTMRDDDGFSWVCWSRSSLSDDLDVLVEEEVLMVDEAKSIMEEYDQARIKLRSKMLKLAKEVEGRRLNSDPSPLYERFNPQIQVRAWELWRGRPVDVLAILASGNITDVEAVAYSNINLQQLVKDAYPET